MSFARVKIRNYKNLNATVDLDPRLNLLVAPNATGKSNFLEALGYVLTNRSFRGLADENITPLNANPLQNSVLSSVSVETEEGDNFQFSFLPGSGKTLQFNEKRTLVSKVQRSYKSIIYAPESMDLILGGPSVRRDFLDNLSQQILPSAARSLKTLKRVVAQKNALLKIGKRSGVNPIQQLKIWNEQLVEVGFDVTRMRLALLSKMIPIASNMAKKLYHFENVELGVDFNSVLLDLSVEGRKKIANSYKEELVRNLSDNAPKEIIVGNSLYGPHRDKFEFRLSGSSAREQSSRGQQRLYSLILHFAAAELVLNYTDAEIIFLLDDVLSELDPVHRSLTITYLQELAIKSEFNDRLQIILTSSDSRDFPNWPPENWRLISVV